MIFYVYITKKLIIFPFFTPRFSIRKFIIVAELFLIRGSGVGVNSLRQTNISWGGSYMQMNRGEGGLVGFFQKLKISTENTFWMPPSRKKMGIVSNAMVLFHTQNIPKLPRNLHTTSKYMCPRRFYLLPNFK